jgi:hypothetical protein
VVRADLDAGRHHIDDVRLLDHRWCERIWTPVATCAQQGGEVFPFLLDSVQAHLGGASSSGRYSTAVAVAVRPLTASHAPCLSVVLRGPPGDPVNGYKEFLGIASIWHILHVP